MRRIKRTNPDAEFHRRYNKNMKGLIASTDDTGTVRTTYTYDPFGNVTVSGEASDNPFQYTGRENDGTGLYYYRARYYSPELQRFISEDPIRLAGGDVNFYAYVGNNPVIRKDPFGLFDNPLPKIPSFSDAYPNSNYVAPIADIVVGGIEAGFAVSLGVASAVGLAAGPEAWWIPVLYGGAAVEAGSDALDRIITGINRLKDPQAKPKNKPKCQ